MKKLLIFITLCLICAGNITAQEYYSFEVELGAKYEHINPDTVYTKVNFEKGTSVRFLRLPFVPKSYFPINGEECEFSVGMGSLEFREELNRDGRVLNIDPFSLDFKRWVIGRQDDSTSHISMAIDTIEGERLMTFQWRNVTFDGSETVDSLNYQVKAFENGIIEMHYGQMHISKTDSAFGEGYTGPDVKFYNTVNCGKPEQCYEVTYRIVGNPGAPHVNEYPVNPGHMDSIPAPGTIYRFTPQIFYNNVDEEFQPIRLNTYPNPVKGSVYFYNEHLTYPLKVQIINAAGQVKSFQLESGENEISLHQKGLIIINLEDAVGKSYSQKILSN